MNIVFTTHANERMKQRRISHQEIEAVLEKPDTIFYTYEDKKIALKYFKNKTIKVVFSQKDETVVIITAYAD